MKKPLGFRPAGKKYEEAALEAEAERQRAEAEHRRAEKPAAQLRALGIEPEKS